MEERSTIVGTWTVQNARASFMDILPTLSNNAPSLQEIEQAHWCIEVWEGRGCVLTDLPGYGSRYGRVYGSPPFLQPAYAHIVTRRAFGRKFRNPSATASTVTNTHIFVSPHGGDFMRLYTNDLCSRTTF